MASKIPEGSPQYDRMPPPKVKPESAPLQGSEPNAWSTTPAIEKRMSSPKLGNAIKMANDPAARAQAPSLLGRVTSNVIDFLLTPFVALGRLLGLVKEQPKEDLSYEIDISEFESQAKQLEEAAVETAVLSSTVYKAKDNAIQELDKFADLIASIRTSKDIDEMRIDEEKRTAQFLDYRKELEPLLVQLRLQIISANDPKGVQEKLESVKDTLVKRYSLESEVEKMKASQGLRQEIKTANAEVEKLAISADNMRIALNRAMATHPDSVNAELKESFDRQLESFNLMNGRFKADLNRLDANEMKARLEELRMAFSRLEQTFNDSQV